MLPWNWRTFMLQSIFRHLLFLISLLSAPFACLSAISPWGPIRLRHRQFTAMHGRRGWALSQLFLAPALDHRHSLCCMHNCLLTHAKALNQFRYSLTRFAQIKPRLHSVRWYCPCTLTSSISIKSDCTRDGRSLLHELSSARLWFWRNSHQRCVWAQNKIWRPPFGPFGRSGRPRGPQSGHFWTLKNLVFWSNLFSPNP